MAQADVLTPAAGEVRTFEPTTYYNLNLPVWSELISVAALKTDPGGDGVYEITWASTDYQLRPVNASAGPEARPYGYQMKPEEEQARLKKMLAMAEDEVKARAAKLPGEAETGKATGKSVRPKREEGFQASHAAGLPRRQYDTDHAHNAASCYVMENASGPPPNWRG